MTSVAQPHQAPSSPTRLTRAAWGRVVRRTVGQVRADLLTVWAAALTYYGLLSLFPAILVLTAFAGMIHDSLLTDMLAQVAPLLPPSVRDLFTSAITNIRDNRGRAGLTAVIGLVVAFWAASGYINAFIQATNAIYDVPEGRPLWKRIPLRLGLTAITGVIVVISILIVITGGRFAAALGNVFGVSTQALDVWQVIKWPILVILVALLFALLYWASPNVRQSGSRWVTPGGLLAVLMWLAASAAFTVYVSHFGHYAATYGALGGVIIFLVWLWLTNMAILIGAEFDAELGRERAIMAGHPAEVEPYLPMRDTSAMRPDNQRPPGL